MGDCTIAQFHERMVKSKAALEKRIMSGYDFYRVDREKIMDSKAYFFMSKQERKRVRAIAFSHDLRRWL